jgi:hypothetical protein
MLLQCAFDVEEHHRYCAQIACDELSSLKQKLAEALEEIRPERRDSAEVAQLGTAG